MYWSTLSQSDQRSIDSDRDGRAASLAEWSSWFQGRLSSPRWDPQWGSCYGSNALHPASAVWELRCSGSIELSVNQIYWSIFRCSTQQGYFVTLYLCGSWCSPLLAVLAPYMLSWLMAYDSIPYLIPILATGYVVTVYVLLKLAERSRTS